MLDIFFFFLILKFLKCLNRKKSLRNYKMLVMMVFITIMPKTNGDFKILKN